MQIEFRVAQYRELTNLRLCEASSRMSDQARVKRRGFVSQNSWLAATHKKLKECGADFLPEAWTANDA